MEATLSENKQIIIISSIVEKFAHTLVRTIDEEVKLMFDENDVISTGGQSIDICILVEKPAFKDKVFSAVEDHFFPVNFIHLLQLFSSIFVLSKSLFDFV